MHAKGWKNGKTGYGIRVGRENAQRFFHQDWETIQVEMDGQDYVFPLNRTFWTTCPEFRGIAIGRWFERQGLKSWKKGHPPIIELASLGERRFRVTVVTTTESS